MEERIVNKLDSGMPRWLIEVGFLLMLDALLPAIVTDSIAIIVLVAYAWAMRKVLV